MGLFDFNDEKNNGIDLLFLVGQMVYYTQKAAFGNCLILQQSQLNQCGISQAAQWEGTDLTPKTGTLESRVHYELVLILKPRETVTSLLSQNNLPWLLYKSTTVKVPLLF